MKPIIGLFVGDTHVMSDTGLCLPGMKIGSKQKRPYSASEDQAWLYGQWKKLEAEVKSRARGKRLFVGFGGDLVDGVNHHDTTQTYGVTSDQVQMAIELFKPLVNAADLCYGVTGTAAHVGDCGDDDRSIYYHFKIDVVETGWVRIDKRLIRWQHHGVAVGQENTKENPMINKIRHVRGEALESGYRPPDAIITHDRHRSFKPVFLRDCWGAVCPCWQLATNYGSGFIAQVNIGALLYDMELNHIERIDYTPAPKIVYHE